MSEISSARKWDRSKLIQNLVSGATGLLVAVELLSVRVPLYFFGQATDRVGEVFHSIARLVRHGLSDVFDQIETGTSTLSDALSLVCTAILVGAGFVFLRRARGASWVRCLHKARTQFHIAYEFSNTRTVPVESPPDDGWMGQSVPLYRRVEPNMQLLERNSSQAAVGQALRR